MVEVDTEPFTEESLQALYDAVSAHDGVSVAELRELLGEFSSRAIAKADLQAYREGRKPWKKLRDEIVPVEHFLSARYPDHARVRFPLDDQPPDAWVTVDNEDAIGIEVTGALARAGVEVGKSLADESRSPVSSHCRTTPSSTSSIRPGYGGGSLTPGTASTRRSTVQSLRGLQARTSRSSSIKSCSSLPRSFHRPTVMERIFEGRS